MHIPFEPIIEVQDLSKSVQDATGVLTILDRVSLAIPRGSSTAIVGASGSGKSTLLGLLAGLDSPTSGSVRLLGRELTELDEDGRAALRSGEVGFVFQSFQLMPHLTALENVMLPLELRGELRRSVHDARPARAQALALLEQVGLAQRTAHYPALLSGGEQQPTGSLDAANGAAIIDLMFEMNLASGATLVLVTHDIELARRCDQIIHIEAGRLADATPLQAL
jgi:putative ABC transport system ATP-binding protein